MPLYNLQSTTIPMLSLHTHSVPSGTSNNYGLLGLSGTGTANVPTMGSTLVHPALGNVLDTGTLLGTSAGLTGVGPSLQGTSSLYGFNAGITGVGSILPNTYGAPSSFIDAGSSASYPFTASALRGAAKLKMLDEMDIPLTRYGNRSSPCSPIPPNTWGLDEFTDSMSASMLHNRYGLALGALDLESKFANLMNFVNYLILLFSTRSCIKWWHRTSSGHVRYTR